MLLPGRACPLVIKPSGALGSINREAGADDDEELNEVWDCSEELKNSLEILSDGWKLLKRASDETSCGRHIRTGERPWVEEVEGDIGSSRFSRGPDG